MTNKKLQELMEDFETIYKSGHKHTALRRLVAFIYLETRKDIKKEIIDLIK